MPAAAILLTALVLSGNPGEQAACSLAPPLAAAGQACVRGELSKVACAWLPILEDLAADRSQDAYIGVERAFGLSRFRAQSLVAPLQLLMAFLVDCPPYRVASKMVDPAVNSLVVATRESKLVLELLFPSEPSVLARLERADPDPAMFSRLERACRGLVELLEGTGIRAAMAATTRDGEMLRPGYRPDLSTWSGGVARYAPLMRQVDSLIEQAGQEPAERARFKLERLAAQPGRPELADVVFARAGFRFLYLGRLEDSLVYLQRAERGLTGRSALRWKALRHLMQLMQMQAYWALDQLADQQSVEERMRREELMPVFETLLAAPGALPGTVGGLLMRAMAAMRGRSFLEIQPVMEAIEILSPEIPGQVDPGVFSSVKIQQRIQAQIGAGRLEGALEELERAWDRSSSFLLAGPAGLIAHAALENGDDGTALRAVDLAVRFMEREAATHRSSDVLRSFMDTSGARPFIAAVFLAEKLGDLRLAFAYAERGRAFSTRRLLGAPVRAGKLSAAESELVADLVALKLGGGVSTESNDFYRRFELRRLERQLAAIEATSAAVDGPPSLEEVQASLDPKETLFAFFTSGAKLLVWRIDRDGFDATMNQWASGDFECLLSDLRWQQVPIAVRAAASARGARVFGECQLPGAGADASTELSSALFGHLLGAVAPGRRLIVIPHGPLHRIPWAALRRPDGRFLAQDHEITGAPSAAAFMKLRATHGPAPTRRRPVLWR